MLLNHSLTSLLVSNTTMTQTLPLHDISHLTEPEQLSVPYPARVTNVPIGCLLGQFQKCQLVKSPIHPDNSRSSLPTTLGTQDSELHPPSDIHQVTPAETTELAIGATSMEHSRLLQSKISLHLPYFLHRKFFQVSASSAIALLPIIYLIQHS